MSKLLWLVCSEQKQLMHKMKNTKAIQSTAFIGLAATVIALTSPSMAQSSKEARESRILETARQSAQLAGGARFCRVDPEEIDAFIGLTDARIAVLARDDYEKVLGKLEFKNLLTAFSAKKPESGCEVLISRFNAVMRGSN